MSQKEFALFWVKVSAWILFFAICGLIRNAFAADYGEYRHPPPPPQYRMEAPPGPIIRDSEQLPLPLQHAVARSGRR